MNITNIIAHFLGKKQQDRLEDITIQLRDIELVINDKVKWLIQQIIEVYSGRTGKSFGYLKSTGTFFQQLEYYLGKNESFVDYSIHCMDELKAKISEQPLSTGGHLIFCKFDSDSKEWLLIAMLKSKEGLSFNQELELLQSNALDLDRLHFAARISLEKDSMERFKVSFVKGRVSIDVTKYFKDFFEVEKLKKS